MVSALKEPQLDLKLLLPFALSGLVFFYIGIRHRLKLSGLFVFVQFPFHFIFLNHENTNCLQIKQQFPAFYYKYTCPLTFAEDKQWPIVCRLIDTFMLSLCCPYQTMVPIWTRLGLSCQISEDLNISAGKEVCIVRTGETGAVTVLDARNVPAVDSLHPWASEQDVKVYWCNLVDDEEVQWLTYWSS